MTLYELHTYLVKYVPNEQLQGFLKLAYRSNDWRLSPGDIVGACEQAGVATEAETVVGAAVAVRLCELYGTKRMGDWKNGGDEAAVGYVGHDVYDDLWSVLNEDPRGVGAPLAKALLITLTDGVTFANSRYLIPIVKEIMEK